MKKEILNMMFPSSIKASLCLLIKPFQYKSIITLLVLTASSYLNAATISYTLQGVTTPASGEYFIADVCLFDSTPLVAGIQYDFVKTCDGAFNCESHSLSPVIAPFGADELTIPCGSVSSCPSWMSSSDCYNAAHHTFTVDNIAAYVPFTELDFSASAIDDILYVGDLNDDGSSDFLVSSQSQKKLQVMSGADNSVFYEINKPTHATFPENLAALGDVDNDGYPDFIYSALLSERTGVTEIISGVDGVQIHEDNGVGSEISIFAYYDKAGDLNSDGFDDYFSGLNDLIIVKSGLDNQALFQFNTVWRRGSYASVGDVNNDNLEDLITVDGSNQITITSGSQALIRNYVDGSLGGKVKVVAGIGDINADGFNDYILGAVINGVAPVEFGGISVRSGFDDSEFYRFSGHALDANIGSALSVVGDLDNDGIQDFIFTRNKVSYIFNQVIPNAAHTVEVISGATGNHLAIFYSTSSDPIEVRQAGDLNGDGYSDLMRLFPAESGGIRRVEFYSVLPAYLDSDHDKYADAIDVFPNDASKAGDHDTDKIDEIIDNCPGVSNYVQSDSDSDGIGNACDDDMDNDGILNINDLHPLNPNAAGDTDHDGVDQLVDNCPTISNYVQSDSDSDGIGNACDDDWDGDGVDNILDTHPWNPLYYTDADRDHINADVDNCPSISNYMQSDSDGDGIGNACDPDVDGDGVDDVLDNYPLNPNIW